MKPFVSVYLKPKYHTSLTPSVRVTSSNKLFPVDLACVDEKEMN